MYELLRRLQEAQNHFDNAAPEYIDAACHEIRAAELALSAYLRETTINTL